MDENAAVWNELAEKYAKDFKEKPDWFQLAAMVEICRYMASSPYGDLYYVDQLTGPGIAIRRRDGQHASKCFRIHPIDENRVEFAVTDSATNKEYYFTPHPKHHEALARFRKHLGELDWSKPVEPHRSIFERLFG